jgi:hypothetical protein
VDILANDLDVGALDTCVPPCLSLYQPTHRSHPENLQDPIRFKNLIKQLESSLLQKVTPAHAHTLLAPFLAVAEDPDFWAHTRDGLAVLGGLDTFHVFRLQRPVPALAIVADSFHTKPLMRQRQSADRFQVLGLTRHSVRLFEGNRDALDEVPLSPVVNAALAEALGDQNADQHNSEGAHTGDERFFRAVDRLVTEHYSKPSALPLLLATLPAHRGVFQALTHNGALLADGIDVHPDAISLDELRQRAWAVMEPHYVTTLDALAEEFGGAKARALGIDDVKAVAAAVAAGRVATLLIEADRLIPGRIDRDSGEIAVAPLDLPDVDDVLDDLAEMAVTMGGRVVVLPADRMPTDTGAAATLRF